MVTFNTSPLAFDAWVSRWETGRMWDERQGGECVCPCWWGGGGEDVGVGVGGRERGRSREKRGVLRLRPHTFCRHVRKRVRRSKPRKATLHLG